jgi:hypothetical protein
VISRFPLETPAKDVTLFSYIFYERVCIMKKIVLATVILLMVFTASGFTETGIGVTAHYPAWALYDAEEGIQMKQFFVGGTIRSKHSILLLDISALYHLMGSTLLGLADVGLCFDLFFFRLGLVGGFQGMYFMKANEYSFCLNGKVNFDVKLGPATVGLSAVVPIYALRFDDQPDRGEGLFILAGVSLNLVYWF